MANNTDTEDVEGPPEAGFDTGDTSAAPPGPAATGPATPTSPMGGQAPATPMGGQAPAGGTDPLSGAINSIMAGLQGSLAQAGQTPVGAQVQQKHGGLVTGLVGVMLDGLAGGMAPSAEMAMKMPLIRQQQQMQMQQMQMEQQKMQEEMRQAPLRDAMQWMQTLVSIQGLRHAMIQENELNQLGMNEMQYKIMQDHIKDGAVTELGGGKWEDISGPNGGLETARRQDPTHALDIMAVPTKLDSQGHILEAQIVRMEAEQMTGEEKTYSYDWKDDQGKVIGQINITRPAHMPVKVATSIMEKQANDQIDKFTGQGKEFTAPQREEMAFQERRATDIAKGITPPTREAFDREYSKTAPEKQQDIADWLESNKLPDTAENREKARVEIAKRASVAKAEEATATERRNIQDQVILSRQYAANPTGANDYAFLLNFIGMTKPADLSKLRLNQQEISLATGTRSSLGDIEALINKVGMGQKLTAKQRSEMLGTMSLIEARAAGVPPGAYPGRDKNGRIIGYSTTADGKNWYSLP